MNSVEMVLALCWGKRIAVSKAERELGFSNGYFRSLKKKEIPADRLAVIASYFGVPVDFLLCATPEAYLLCSEYQLAQAEKAYAKETDAEKREQLTLEIDGLRESISDQRLGNALIEIERRNAKKPTTEHGDGLTDSDIKLVRWFRSLPPEKQQAILISQDAPEGLL